MNQPNLIEIAKEVISIEIKGLQEYPRSWMMLLLMLLNWFFPLRKIYQATHNNVTKYKDQLGFD